MRAGDLVRFKPPYFISAADGVYSTKISEVPWYVGLLVEYESWEKMAVILYNGEVLRIIARHVQKHGSSERHESR
jgi:hypothetical protein